jgi:hypothetical protein
MTHSKQIAGLVGLLLAAIGIAGAAIGIAGHVLLVLGAFLSYTACGPDAGGA